MSNDNVVLSKKVRPKFTGKLMHDEWAENPANQDPSSISIHLWEDRHTDLPNSQEIRSYQEAIHELYKNIYPEAHRTLPGRRTAPGGAGT